MSKAAKGLPDPLVAERLRFARQAAGYERAVDAARAFGWVFPTYHSHENGNRGLGEAAAAYTDAFKVSMDWLVKGKGVGPSTRGGMEGETIRPVPVVGEIQAGRWVEHDGWPPDKHYALMLPVEERYAKLHPSGLVVRGTSMNRLYAEGTILICVEITLLERPPLPGEKVIVQRRDRNGQIEATVKELALAADGKLWLWPRSDDPAHQSPIPMPEEEDGEDSVRVTALVVGSYRRETV